MGKEPAILTKKKIKALVEPKLLQATAEFESKFRKGKYLSAAKKMSKVFAEQLLIELKKEEKIQKKAAKKAAKAAAKEKAKTPKTKPAKKKKKNASKK
ncbi:MULTISPECIES: hypothetical protein [unclassified Paraflavitalea]|uniref:hypothetical protein n=1 Tax=unclassified Paraflavitalea TaxID=2798305 RepID=UPI003D325998